MNASIQWNFDRLCVPPEMQPDERHVEPGVRALFYRGLDWQGKPTRVFAWYGAPEKPTPTGRFPAMVLVHGGGGTAFAEWVRLWTRRGYAALAMDLCGCVPEGSYANWTRHAAGGPPGWDKSFEQLDWPLADQWPNQATAAVILGHSLVRSFPEVDPARVGLTGISWGGYLTCLVAGEDSRFRFAAPVYGCGFLGDNSAWLDAFKKMGQDRAGRWLELWDPSVYLPRVARPMLWVTGTNDFAYPLDSLQKSYRLPPGPRTLAIRVRMPHGHGGAGENPEEIHVFANSLFKDAAPLPRIEKQGLAGPEAWVSYAAGPAVVRAELNFTTASGAWPQREWKTLPARLEPGARRVSTELPAGTTVFYFNLYDARDALASSEHVTLP
jgi:dienelactone hydrolase